MIRSLWMFLRELSWSAIFAVVLAIIAVFSAISGSAGSQLPTALGLGAVTLALISLRD
jgi:hypothetical protein